MQPTYHVNLGDSKAERVTHHAHDFVDRVLERVSIALFCRESAELARQDTNVGIIDVAIVDVRCVIAVFMFAHHVRNHSQSVEIIREKESERIRL